MNRSKSYGLIRPILSKLRALLVIKSICIVSMVNEVSYLVVTYNAFNWKYNWENSFEKQTVDFRIIQVLRFRL